ncbi:MAG: lysophospholipid transporter LplT [Corticimicrobacter sp.]|uniref:lysophospholipid transporter LplT n=1 Tax=Corticimicrobacter sp. TaxID=2678536 RepID=UPI0032DB13C6
MKRNFYLVMAAQFFSSLADNALFIVAIALIQLLHGPDWMAPMVKWVFALSYVLLAAYVGAIADSFPKGRVMFATNAIKVVGCLMMFLCAGLQFDDSQRQVWLVCSAYALVGIGAAAYSPAKYGIVTEMLPPSLLVKGNSWIEGLTVLSVILGMVLGGFLVSPQVSEWLLEHPWLSTWVHTSSEAAILIIACVYLTAAGCNLLIPDTGVRYPRQQKNPMRLMRIFLSYVVILWRDKLGQISLAVTTLFWGAGATLQLIVIKWGEVHLGYAIDHAAMLMGVTAVGIVVGSILAGRIPLQRALAVLPVGVLMGLAVLLMPIVKSTWSVYALLLLIGTLSGFFVVPMNALLQHRGHFLLSAGHSIAVQNFNEQLNILLMVAMYSLMLRLDIPINTIIIIFGVLVAVLMLVFMRWSKLNLAADPRLHGEIGKTGHGSAL